MAKYTRTSGPDRNNSLPGRAKEYRGMYIGYVQANQDIQKMGRLQVWIPEFGSHKEDESGWFTISYSSPFAGATSVNGIGPNVQLEKDTMTSYGFWAVPPDLDNQVIVMFANGDPTRGVMMGCLYQQFMNKMVPGLPADENYQFPDFETPTAEYNKNTTENIKDNIKRPALFEAADGINTQGLIHDNVRGLSTSGARRESPSEVYGMLTPGPKNSATSDNREKPARRLGGHQFYMDDKEGAEHVRIRTRGGTQLLLDETNGLVYAINKAGTSWIQMDAEGNFDIFAAKGVSVRSQEDINFRADRDINIEAGRNMNIKAAKDYTGSTDGSVGAEGEGSGGNIAMQSKNSLNLKVEDEFIVSTEGKISFTSEGSISSKADGKISLQADGKVSVQGASFDSRTTGVTSLDGSVVNIQKGSAVPSDAAGDVVTEISKNSKTNVLLTFVPPINDTRDTQTALTIVGRFLTFEPCPEHNNKGT